MKRLYAGLLALLFASTACSQSNTFEQFTQIAKGFDLTSRWSADLRSELRLSWIEDERITAQWTQLYLQGGIAYQLGAPLDSRRHLPPVSPRGSAGASQGRKPAGTTNFRQPAPPTLPDTGALNARATHFPGGDRAPLALAGCRRLPAQWRPTRPRRVVP
jgi:hypothetical protein